MTSLEAFPSAKRFPAEIVEKMRQVVDEAIAKGWSLAELKAAMARVIGK